MKTKILSLIVAAVLFVVGTSSAAPIPQLSLSQSTNVVLTWPSSPGERFMVLHRLAFHPSLPWKLLATNLSAGPFSHTTFTHVGGVPRGPVRVLTGGGGAPGSPAAAFAAPTSDPITSPTDPAKVKQNGAAPPALPDEKEMEKQFREWLKEREKQQKKDGNGNSVQAFSTTAAFTLPDSAYTNITGGFYVITHTTDDTDLDGLPDWWEAANGLALLVNDAAADPDDDNVPNLAEYAYGTNPNDPNSKPVVTVSYTSPVNTNTHLPVVQITGSINLNVRTLLFSVTNAAGIQTDLEGFVTKRIVSPGAGFTNSPSRYTNSFQCFDVPLTNGVNTVGLRFTDAFGLTFATTVSFTVNFAASPAAPVGTVFWPASGTKIGTDTFTVRGRLDNATASVVARMTIDGEVEEIGGLVERDGTFWIEDLPTPANGPVTLVFTDAGGKARTNTLSLSRSPVSLYVYDPSGPNLWDATTTLYGTVSDADHSVWVNSTRATVDENGNWYADNVPINSGGVASLAVRAVPNSANGGAGTGAAAMSGNGGLGGLYTIPSGNPTAATAVDATYDFDKPPRIIVSSYTLRSQDDNSTFITGHTNRQTMDWTRNGGGGSGNEYRYFEYKYAPGNYYGLAVIQQTDLVTYPYPGTDGTGISTGALNTGELFTNTYSAYPAIPWETGSTYQRTAERNHSYKGETQLELQTGGRGYARSASLFEFNATATAFNAEGGSASLTPESLRILEQALDDAGYAYRTNLPANISLALTFAAVNAAAQVPATSSPSSGVRVGFATATGSLKLDPTGPHYYVTRTNRNGVAGLVTNNGPLYLGYSEVRLPYRLDGVLVGGLTESIGVAPPLTVHFPAAHPIALGSRLFRWDGVVPIKRIGTTSVTQRQNTRQFINPGLTSLRMFVDATEGRYGTNTTRLAQASPPIRLVARAIATSGVSEPNHIGVIAGNLQTAGYSPEPLNGPTLEALTNAARLGLIWYSLSHRVATNGTFAGLALGGGFRPSHLSTNALNYSLVFMNGCESGSQNEAGGATAAFRARFGANCVFLGWREAIDHARAMSFAVQFFQRLAEGNSVALAVSRAMSNAGLGDQRASSDSTILVRDNLVILPAETSGLVVDLTR